MKQILLTTIVLLVTGLTLRASEVNQYFVKAGVEGDGTSWKSAFADLQSALAIARPGDIVWVAAGTYVPTADGDRTVHFAIPTGVKVYGGFAGTEKRLEDRKLTTTNSSILSGEIGDLTTREDNSYTVVYFRHADANTVLDGFTIAGGYADGYEETADVTTCGAAVFNDGQAGFSSPVISQCVFLDNYAREGAAIYNFAYKGECSPTISGCVFTGNQSNFNGGAVFNDGNYGICNPTIKNCSFDNNEAMYGAGILNRGLYGVCKPLIMDSEFTNNFALSRGSAVYQQREGKGVCEPTIERCIFEDNVSTVGDDNVDGTMDFSTPSATPVRSGVRKRAAEPAAVPTATAF